MTSRRVIATAYLLDWIAGDPEWFPHPVRLMGKCIEKVERGVRRHDQSSFYELAAGCVLTAGLVTASYWISTKIITWARSCDLSLGIVTEITLAWTCLASRNLHDEALSVVAAMDSSNIVLARQRLARIVGRDTLHLDEHEICRAVIETVAESAGDGVVAPLFYMAIGGVPLAIAYKAINTLDSMIGHADKEYFYFGKVAARLDDVANFIPARLTALAIVASASIVDKASPSTAVETWLRDGEKHKSPNAGQPESAMAGALQVCLGGANYYDGEVVATPLIGDRFPKPSVHQARQAVQIAAIVSAFAIAGSLFMRRRK